MVINWACVGHNWYIYAWISKEFYTVVVLEKEKCHSNYLFTYVEGEGHIRRSNDKMIIN